MERNNPSKPLQRRLRKVVLRSVDRSGASEFMEGSDSQFMPFMKAGLDHYPLHWIMHFTHASQIIGYKHPDLGERMYWHRVYLWICEQLHLVTETEEVMDVRPSDHNPELTG